MIRISIRLGTVLFLGWLLVACDSNQPQTVGDLPTIAALPTLTATLPVTLTVTATASSTATDTITPSPTLLVSDTPSVTPSATITDTPTPTATDTPLPSDTPFPTADNEGLLALVQMAARATVLPSNLIPAAAPTIPGATVLPVVPICSTPPSGGFVAVYNSDPSLAAQIGCPLGVISFATASQTYQTGQMVWMAGPPQAIYVLFGTGRFQRYDDTYNSAVDPVSGGEIPPAGLIEPVRGFGKVWRTFGEVRALGWATSDEAGGQSTAQIFERGQMVFLPQRGMIFVLITDNGGLSGGWRTVVGSF